MPSGLDVGRRFNDMQEAVKKSLHILVKEYNKNGLYMYDSGSMASRLGITEENTLSIVQLLINHDFVIKTGSGYRLNRQRADTLIDLGLLDSKNMQVSPIDPASPSPDDDIVFEEELSKQIANIFENVANIFENVAVDIGSDASLENALDGDADSIDDVEEPKHEDDINNPSRMSMPDFKINIDQPGKNKRLRLVEIVDLSIAGRKINPPLWIVCDTLVNRLYLVAQDGLQFKEPDKTYYVGLRQLSFLKSNPQFILGSFADNEQGENEARLHASRFFDTVVNNTNIIGYYPRKVGDKFWVVQSARTGTYAVLKRGLSPSLTMDKNKVDGLTFKEAIGVFEASEAKAAANKQSTKYNFDE